MDTPSEVEPGSASPAGAPIEAVEELCERIRTTHDGDAAEASLLCDFARGFWSRAPGQLLRERSPDDLAALTRGAFEFAAAPDPSAAGESAAGESGAAGVRVQMTSPSEEGWSAPATVIRTLVSDRPFIVDTIREFLGSEGVAIREYLYPVLRLERDAEGRLVGAGPGSSGERYSLNHCEVQRIPGESRRAWVVDELRRRLEQVVAVTEDFGPMLEALESTRAVVASYGAAAEQANGRDAAPPEILEFLRWLEDGHFIFLGYREYGITGSGEERGLEVRRGTGLGILRREEGSAYATRVPLRELSPELVGRLTEGPLLIVNKTNAESPVHRRSRMDYVGVKEVDGEGRVLGERRFLGLFTSKAYAESAEEIPILRRKLRRILERSGEESGSHDYKEIITIFNSMPKEDLFQASAEDLEREVQAILAQLFTEGVRVLVRPDPLGRGASVAVILPEARFSRPVRERIEEVIAIRLDGTVLAFHHAHGTADQARLHFYVSAPREAVQALDAAELERELGHIIWSWEDRLLDTLVEAHGPEEGSRLWDRYAPAFGEDYRAAFLPAAAGADVAQLEGMRERELDVDIAFREPRGRGRAGDFRAVTILKLYLRDHRMVLSEFMPILENAGLRVIELAPFLIDGPGLAPVMVYSFAVQAPDGAPLDPERTAILAEALLAVRSGDAPDDLFNSLVLAAGLRWREVDLLRTYASYAFQADAVPSRLAPARALQRHPDVARLLVALIGTRFDPALRKAHPEPAAGDPSEALQGAIAGALEAVTSLADDRAIRRLLNLVLATTRTNYYRHGGADSTRRSGGVPYISIKIACAEVEELRRSGLLYEIFVHSSRMEGIHLRGAPVSRGGIRWSDRPDDFRTEVLGLVQTQVVKNAVIVPSGSKGGFVTRLHTDDRDALLADEAEQYRTLMCGLLDITDTIVDGRVVPPPDVVRHDGDDPYLVVAADKGTAHLSDTANAVAEEYDFWLGDAFASGGSYGYDHKKEGITARGAWECVKRHFWELGKDIQAEPFTVAGIGDMSGDVFGNGMLLSRQIRLVAAFDHRHVFLDPDPDPATSFAERERLFALSRSTWDDYDRDRLSPGGMIVPRQSKEVTLSPEARRALGGDVPEKLDGEELIRAVLRAPVELLWNGGIGTYVKAADETHGEAGDAANDPVRVDAHELRCQVIGEGGNLGLTQRARVSFALAGGRLNTDALDNSAGVDMSDHEVNLKILLYPMLSAGEIGLEERNRLLASMTDAVAERVLRNSRGQSLAVSLDERRSRDALQDFAALIRMFERKRVLERDAEGLPGSETLQERAETGSGLSRPALSVLLAYAKLDARAALLDSTLPDDPALLPLLRRYFPDRAVETAGDDRLRGHRLRREIVVTVLVNDLFSLMGASFLHRVARDTGADLAAVARAWVIANGIAGADAIRSDLALDRSRFLAETVYRWLDGLARVLERTTHWALANVAPGRSAAEAIAEATPGLDRLRDAFPDLVAGEDRALFDTLLEELQATGIDHGLARRLITLRFLPQLLDILRIAREAGEEARSPAAHDVIDTARAYYLVSERFGCAALRAALRTAAREERWEKRLVDGLIEDIGRAHRWLARTVLSCLARNGGRGSADADDRTAAADACLSAIQAARPREVAAYRELVEELEAAEDVTVAGYAVAVRLLREIAG